MTIEQLKKEWKEYLLKNPKWRKTIGHHHYFRTRYSSKFWLNKIEQICKELKESIS